MDLTTEKHLVKMAKKSFEYFGVLYDLNYERILSYVIVKTGDIRAAADITSEVFFKAMKNLSKFKWQKVPFSSWLYKIANNEISNFYNKEKKQGKSLDWLMEEAGYEPEDKIDIEKEILDEEERLEKSVMMQEIKKEINKLDKKYKEVIILKFWKKMKVKDISIFLNKKENTIKSLLSRGIKRLNLEPEMQPKIKNKVISLEQEK